jgi:hypothetical protein
MTQRIAGQPAPEFAVPCWIDGEEGTLASHAEGARPAAQASLFLPALVLPLARISNSPSVGSRRPRHEYWGRRSPDRIRGRLGQSTMRAARRSLSIPRQ